MTYFWIFPCCVCHSLETMFLLSLLIRACRRITTHLAGHPSPSHPLPVLRCSGACAHAATNHHHRRPIRVAAPPAHWPPTYIVTHGWATSPNTPPSSQGEDSDCPSLTSMSPSPSTDNLEAQSITAHSPFLFSPPCHPTHMKKLPCWSSVPHKI
jgi:hypothetical protein